MIYKGLKNGGNCRNRLGIVLLITLVLLIVLATLGYTLSARVAARRHRDQYIIDYQKARYACDSAIKYALAMLQDIKTPQLIARPDEPDFSDLFILSETEYQDFLAEWAAENAFETDESFYDTDEFNDVNDMNDISGVTDLSSPDSLTVRGPYGPPWPFITEPIEFQIGSATVKIQIEDENAKYPVGWAILGNERKSPELRDAARASFETFCEWMGIDEMEIDSLKGELKEVNKIKPFKLKFKPIRKRIRTKQRIRYRGRRHRRGRRRRYQYRYRTKTISVPEQVTRQARDLGRLFHSSLLDTELLARPTVLSDTRKESALKYMSLWGSRKVNINTAPRQVLEAAFIFGGDEVEIAEEIIQRRRLKPFENLGELKKSLFRYSNSIDKCKDYITTASTFFTIKVTAISGVAETSAVIALTKDGRRTRKIAVISD